jgi:hypothetical protein
MVSSYYRLIAKATNNGLSRRRSNSANSVRIVKKSYNPTTYSSANLPTHRRVVGDILLLPLEKDLHKTGNNIFPVHYHVEYRDIANNQPATCLAVEWSIKPRVDAIFFRSSKIFAPVPDFPLSRHEKTDKKHSSANH